MNFKINDAVEVEINGALKIGTIIKFHSLGDMAEVDFGDGDVYGIALNRIRVLQSNIKKEAV